MPISQNRPSANPPETLIQSRAAAVAPLVLLFFSGGLALVYEILWMRRLTDLFGATTPATAATLAAVFLGFTAGSVVLGRRAEWFAKPLRAYGWMEMGAGAGALLFDPLLKLYDQLYPAFYRSLGGSPAGFLALKTLLAMVALFIPAFCMGGTIPILGSMADQGRRRLGVTAGALYAANTLGATLGALSVPFFWLPTFGVSRSYRICVAGSLVIGLVAWWLGSSADVQAKTAPARPAARKVGTTPNREPFSKGILALLAGLSGLLLFVLQVEWGRMFAQVHENSIYSFSVVLAVFLGGLAIGAWLSRALLQRGLPPRQILGYAWLGGGCLIFVSPHVFYALTGGLTYLQGSGGWASYGAKIFWLTLPTVLAPTVLAGMVLPLIMEMSGAADRPAGRVLGSVLGLNTAGSILGALVAAFALPGWLGVWGSIALSGTVMMVAAEGCFWNLAKISLRRLASIATLLILLGFWNPSSLPRTHLQPDQGETLDALDEGSHGIVAVVTKQGSRRMKLDNFYILGGTSSTGDERMQGHLPLSLHPAPTKVAFLGLGTGISAGAALLHPSVQQIHAIEIVPEIARAAQGYFHEENLHLGSDPRVTVVLDDARNFLRASGQQYDVIVGDLVVPWRRGESALYSAEHFAAARRALRPRGIFCQWLPMFQLSEEEFRIAVATFLDAFPRTTLWRGDFAPQQPALALVGQADDAAIEPRWVEQRLRELKKDKGNPHLVHPAGLWMFWVGILDPNDPMFAQARRNSASAPWLEILGPLAHAGSAQRNLFVGRPLEAFLEKIRKQPLTGVPLQNTTPEVLRWREAGARIAEASLLLSEGKIPEGEAMMQRAVATLPAEVQSGLLAGAVQGNQ